MWGRLPLPHVFVAVALGVVSGVYIYRPVFMPPAAPHAPEATAGPPSGADADKRL